FGLKTDSVDTSCAGQYLIVLSVNRGLYQYINTAAFIGRKNVEVIVKRVQIINVTIIFKRLLDSKNAFFDECAVSCSSPYGVVCLSLFATCYRLVKQCVEITITMIHADKCTRQ